jgi:transposase
LYLTASYRELPPLQAAGATVRDLAGILRHFDSNLSNGSVEAFNAHIRAAKARAKGYAPTPT